MKSKLILTVSLFIITLTSCESHRHESGYVFIPAGIVDTGSYKGLPAERPITMTKVWFTEK